MRVDCKRFLNKFKETTMVYFKRNYYFMAQKYLILNIIKKVFIKFIECYRKKQDDIVNKILKDKNQKDIINNLQKCFLTKLKCFAQLNQVNIEIDDNEIIKNRQGDIDKDNRGLPPAIMRNNSIELINNFDIDFDEINRIKEDKIEKENPQHDEKNWFIYKPKKWTYLKTKTS